MRQLDAHGLDVFNALSIEVSTVAAATRRSPGLDELLRHSAENRRFIQQVEQYLMRARIIPAQGRTCWVDRLKRLGLTTNSWNGFMVDVAGIAPLQWKQLLAQPAVLFAFTRVSARVLEKRWRTGNGRFYSINNIAR